MKLESNFLHSSWQASWEDIKAAGLWSSVLRRPRPPSFVERLASDNSESETDNDGYIASTASIKIIQTIKLVEKICIAPGEKGSFQNWGEDAFLEEKCFPELFLFGHGGYVSSTLGGENLAVTGFANYVKHRLLSANPKFRNNTSYMFFLLLVKELIQLAQSKQT